MLNFVQKIVEDFVTLHTIIVSLLEAGLVYLLKELPTDLQIYGFTVPSLE